MSLTHTPMRMTPSESSTEATASWSPVRGDGVRVREGVGDWIAFPNLPHSDSEAGHVGAVVDVRAPLGVTDHPFLVMFDPPVPLAHMIGRYLPLLTRHYAAEELEPITA